jgi:hypothetical protein
MAPTAPAACCTRRRTGQEQHPNAPASAAAGRVPRCGAEDKRIAPYSVLPLHQAKGNRIERSCSVSRVRVCRTITNGSFKRQAAAVRRTARWGERLPPARCAGAATRTRRARRRRPQPSRAGAIGGCRRTATASLQRWLCRCAPHAAVRGDARRLDSSLNSPPYRPCPPPGAAHGAAHLAEAAAPAGPSEGGSACRQHADEAAGAWRAQRAQWHAASRTLRNPLGRTPKAAQISATLGEGCGNLLFHNSTPALPAHPRHGEHASNRPCPASCRLN